MPGERLTWHTAATTTGTPAKPRRRSSPRPHPAPAPAHFVKPISAHYWISEGYGVPGPGRPDTTPG